MRKYKKIIAIYFAFNLLMEICFPTIAYALSGGPSQPEVQSFEPAGTTEMVDLFTGDFNYNIPLLDVEGYPVNLSYHSGITMDQEASWVGLGWNINPGVINRNKRGLPDDFAGDKIENTVYMKPNKTVGVETGATVAGELFGFDIAKVRAIRGRSRLSLSRSLGVFYNNYKGVGVTKSIGMGASLEIGKRIDNGSNSMSSYFGFNYGLNRSFNSQEGLTRSYTISSSLFHIQAGYLKSTNSRSEVIFRSTNVNIKNYKGSKSYIPANLNTYVPSLQMPMSNFSEFFRVSAGGEIKGFHPATFFNGYLIKSSIASGYETVQKPGYGYLYSHLAKVTSSVHDVNREKDGAYTFNNPVLAGYTAAYL